jgi:hypothetical protein
VSSDTDATDEEENERTMGEATTSPPPSPSRLPSLSPPTPPPPVRDTKRRLYQSSSTSPTIPDNPTKRSRLSENESPQDPLSNETISGVTATTNLLKSQQLNASPQESMFIRVTRLLWELKLADQISSDDYFRICLRFRKEHETYLEMFLVMMTEELRMKWLQREGLI